MGRPGKEAGRKLTSHDVLRVLADLFIRRGTPAYIGSDDGPEFAPAPEAFERAPLHAPS